MLCCGLAKPVQPWIRTVWNVVRGNRRYLRIAGLYRPYKATVPCHQTEMLEIVNTVGKNVVGRNSKRRRRPP